MITAYITTYSILPQYFHDWLICRLIWFFFFFPQVSLLTLLGSWGAAFLNRNTHAWNLSHQPISGWLAWSSTFRFLAWPNRKLLPACKRRPRLQCDHLIKRSATNVTRGFFSPHWLASGKTSWSRSRPLSFVPRFPSGSSQGLEILTGRL